ncbi:TPA: hypothetical protein VH932_001209 [Streptococcus pyogenes]|nr:hypothetical protein [Streptococcus pyogenes]
MSYISEYLSRKRKNLELVQSLPLESQSFWLEFLTNTDKAESSAERRHRHKSVSLDYSLKNEKDGHETTVIDLFIDNSPTALDTIIKKEEDDFIASLLPKLNSILYELDEDDKNIILLYFENDKIPPYRQMERQLNMDYRKIKRHIPNIMKHIEDKLKE